MRLFRLLATTVLLAGLLSPIAPAAAQSDEEPVETEAAERTENLSHVANLQYEFMHGNEFQDGTDVEFATLEVPVESGAPPEEPEPEPTDLPTEVPTDDPSEDPEDPTEDPSEDPSEEPSEDPEEPSVREVVARSSGAGRIVTAAEISEATFGRARLAVVARADEYADALAGAPLAAFRAAPLLLTDSQELSPEAMAEMQRLGVEDALLLGGTDALSQDVAADLEGEGIRTRRLGGANRFATAALVSNDLPATDEVLIAEGANADDSRGWPDALSASGFGATLGLPILLATRDSLPPESAAELAADVDATIVGGTAAVGPDVQAEVDRASATVTRLGGANRYDTSALVAREALERGVNPAVTWLATGLDFADGLVAGAAAGADRGLLLLVDGQDLDASAETLAFIQDNAARFEELNLAGGTDAISEASMERLRQIVGDGQGAGSSTSQRAAGSAAAETETREFAIASSYVNGLQIIDISDPTQPEVTSVYDCGTRQGDTQVFTRGDRTYATFSSEDTSSIVIESQCVVENDLPLEDLNGDGQITTYAEKLPAYGVYIADITDPFNPTTAGFVPIPIGSHNNTVDPSGNYLYNSNAQLLRDDVPRIEVYDIRDLRAPELINELFLPVAPGLASESHDITFSDDGTRAYSAALADTVIINTEDIENPTIVSFFEDPAINVEHQSDPVTVTDEAGNEKEFLIVQDEQAGAAGNGLCPGGGLHVYDITGSLEETPVKVGAFFIDETMARTPDGTGTAGLTTCTSHVYDIYPEQGIMTIAWYEAGVRVLDLNGLADLVTDPTGAVDGGITELGFFYFNDSDTWSVKTNRIEEDGSFFMYGNDRFRGFDVYRFEPDAQTEDQAESAGTWLTPQEALDRADANPVDRLSADNPLYCMIGLYDAANRQD